MKRPQLTVQEYTEELSKKGSPNPHNHDGVHWSCMDVRVGLWRDITLPTKVRLVKAMVFPLVMYGCESWTVYRLPNIQLKPFGRLWLSIICDGLEFTDSQAHGLVPAGQAVPDFLNSSFTWMLSHLAHLFTRIIQWNQISNSLLMEVQYIHTKNLTKPF